MMPKISMYGRGQGEPRTPRRSNLPPLRVIVLPGIGDVIYTWYKLINYVDMGYEIDVQCLDCEPRRSHQMMGMLSGMRSFDYVGGFDYGHYWLVQVDDLRTPPPRSLFRGVPVLHMNSWPESGRRIDEFMPSFPCRYDIDLTTDEESVEWAQKAVDADRSNIFLYTSSYRNNVSCNNHPDPEFWIDATLSAHEWRGVGLPPKVFLVGAAYDSDLTTDVHSEMLSRGVDAELVLDQPLGRVTELLRSCDMALAYESGFAMMADCMRVPLLWFIRQQGGNRDDHFFPYSGSVNPDGLGRWIFPFFYDQDADDVERALSEIAAPGGDGHAE